MKEKNQDILMKLLRIFSIQKNYRYLILLEIFLSIFLYYTDIWTHLLPQIIIVNVIVGLFYFAIFPGLLGVELLLPKNSEPYTKFLFIVPLSIAFDYLLLFFINLGHYILRLSYPLDRHYVIPCFCFFLTLIIVWLNRYDDFHFNAKSIILHLKEVPTKLALNFFIVSILVTIIGILLLQKSSNSNILMLLILFFCFIPLLISLIFFSKTFFSKEYKEEIDLSFRLWDSTNLYIYPVIIYTISLSLLWQQTLISPVFRNGDIITEVMIFKNVLNNLWWDPYFLSNSPPSGTMSVTLLPYLFSYLLIIDHVWYFKFIYPILFALVPVILYKIYEIVSNKTLAFLASYLFLMSPVYTVLLTQDTRQGVAELFICIIILLLIEKYHISTKKKFLLFFIYCFGLVASHYGAATFMLLFFFIASLIIYFSQWFLHVFNISIKKPNYFIKISNFFSIESNFSIEKLNNQKLLWNTYNNKTFIKYSIILLFIFLTYNLYIYLPIFSKILYKFINILKELIIQRSIGINNVVSLNVQTDSGGITLINLMTYFLIIFLILGCISLLYYFIFFILKRNTIFTVPFSYLSISMSAAFTGVFLILLQSFSGFGIGIERSYHIISIFLSVFSIIGIFLIGFFIAKLLKVNMSLTKIYSVCLLLSTLLLSIFFLFQTGFIFEIVDDIPISYSLSYEKNLIVYNFENDIFIEKWLITKGDKESNLYLNMNSLQEYARTDILPMILCGFTTSNFPSNKSYVLVKTGFALSDQFWLTDYNVYRKNVIIVPIKNNIIFDRMNIIYDNVAKVYINKN